MFDPEEGNMRAMNRAVRAKGRSTAFGAGVGIAFLLGMAPLAQPALAQVGRDATTDVNALVKAAKAEGETTFYCSPSENVCKRLASSFEAQYGVKASFLRMTSGTLLQRYAAEAQAGNASADLVIVAGGIAVFAADGVKNGWIEPVVAAGIPALRSAEFPDRFTRGPTAIVGIQPWAFYYNPDKVKGGDIPREWTDLLNTRFKGQVLVADPKATDAALDVWALLLDKYGEGYYAKLRGQEPRSYAAVIPALQALGAGEGSVGIPSGRAAIEELKARGAPIVPVVPGMTTGIELQVMLTARNISKHPNAGRLMAHYVMSRAGNKVFNDDPGSVGVYDTANLPSGYESPKPGTLARKETIYKLLGY
jgi:iron(III) transport system substrate-binding protein